MVEFYVKFITLQVPVLFFPKKDGKLSFCIYYRKPNSMMVKYMFPLSSMDQYIDKVGYVEYFTTSYACSGYWKMKIHQQDRPKVEFSAETLQLTRMTFGLTNAPTCFQWALYIILKKYKWKTCIVYLDGVTFFSKNVPHWTSRRILTALADAGVTFNISKCPLYQRNAEYSR